MPAAHARVVAQGHDSQGMIEAASKSDKTSTHKIFILFNNIKFNKNN